MAWSNVLSTFTQYLNRNEVTNDTTGALATAFLVDGMQRIQRDCRLPCMERQLIITPTTAPLTSFPVPQDLLQPIDVLVSYPAGTNQDNLSLPYYDALWAPRPLRKVDYRVLMRANPNMPPEMYARQQTLYWIAGAVPIGQQVQFLYYGNFSPITSLDSDNEITASNPDLVVYAGLTYAGPYYQHPMAAQWEQLYQRLKADVQQAADDVDANGGPQAVALLYSFDQD